MFHSSFWPVSLCPNWIMTMIFSSVSPLLLIFIFNSTKLRETATFNLTRHHGSSESKIPGSVLFDLRSVGDLLTLPLPIGSGIVDGSHDVLKGFLVGEFLFNANWFQPLHYFFQKWQYKKRLKRLPSCHLSGGYSSLGWTKTKKKKPASLAQDSVAR